MLVTTVSAVTLSAETIGTIVFPDGFTFSGGVLSATTVPAYTVSGWFPPGP
jgi:hypothetical protein